MSLKGLSFDLRGFLPLTYTHIPLGYGNALKSDVKHLKRVFGV
jgi:hypothetical protein